MAREKNLSLIFKNVPTAFPVAGEHLTVEDRGYDPSAAPSPGGVVVQNIYTSFDPYMRGRMSAPEKKSYFPPFTLGGPLPRSASAALLNPTTKTTKRAM